MSDWKTELNRYVEESEGVLFKYGKRDCFLFTVKWLETLWRKELLASITPEGYKSLKDGQNQALKLLKIDKSSDFLRDLWIALAKRWKMKKVDPSKAQNGDVILVKFRGRTTSCIIKDGRGLTTGRCGLVWIFLDKVKILESWRVDKCRQ